MLMIVNTLFPDHPLVYSPGSGCLFYLSHFKLRLIFSCLVGKGRDARVEEESNLVHVAEAGLRDHLLIGCV